MPTWPDHAIFWQVYPLGFTGAPVRPVEAERGLAHRLPQLTGWLDHAQRLGVNGLLLGPIFEASTHGYDTTDHYALDRRLGDDADLDALISGCRERGINVVLDGVFNHVGSEHPLFQQALREGPGGAASRLFRIDWQAEPPRPAIFEGHGGLVALNHDEPAVAEFVADVMLHWLRRGVMGWRLDAAYAVPPTFWRPVLERVRAEFPQAWFVGEVIHGDYAGLVEASGLDSVTQYELWKSIWSSLNDENFFELDWTLRRHEALLDTFVPQTFVGNHDVSRLASVVGRTNVPLALAVLFTVAGVPSVYYGDEFGLEGIKRDGWGGDDEVRPAFPALPDDGLGAEVLRLHQQLIGLRRQHPWLVRARMQGCELRNGFLRYRSYGDGGWLEVTLNLEGEPWARIAGEDGVLWQS